MINLSIGFFIGIILAFFVFKWMYYKVIKMKDWEIESNKILINHLRKHIIDLGARFGLQERIDIPTPRDDN